MSVSQDGSSQLCLSQHGTARVRPIQIQPWSAASIIASPLTKPFPRWLCPMFYQSDRQNRRDIHRADHQLAFKHLPKYDSRSQRIRPQLDSDALNLLQFSLR
jgi:hypothetical protein